MKKGKGRNKRGSMSTRKYIFIIGLIAVVMCLTAAIGMRVVLHMEKSNFQAVIGELYETDPEAADQVLGIALGQWEGNSKNLLFQNVDSDKISLGRKAAYRLGYTTEVYDIYYKQGNRKNLQSIFVLVMIILGFSVIFLFSRCYLSFQREVYELCNRIRKFAKESIDFLEKKDFMSCWGNLPEWRILEREICKIIEDRQKQNRYMERREKQISLYVENLAHQIKTPLAGLLLNLEILERKWVRQTETEGNENCKDKQERSSMRREQKGEGGSERNELQLLADSRNLGEKIQEYVMRILNLARMEAGKIHFQKDLVELIDLLREIQQELGEDTVKLEGLRENETENSDLNKTLEIVIQGDRKWLYEAICNLVENGRKHAETDEPIVIRVIELRDEVKIEIIDRGKGISKEELELLFDRYSVTDAADQFSTGIGLNLARYVVLGHYGDIHVESERNQGTKLELRLPKFDLKDKVALE